MHFIVLDLETTCWETAYPKRDREIIEIGLVVLNAFGEEVTRFERLFRPVLHPYLSGYCTRLTGITQEDVDGQPSYEEHHRQLCEWLDQFEGKHFLAWGPADEVILQRAADRMRTDSLINGPYLDVKESWHQIKRLSFRMGFKKAVKHEGLTFEGDHHRALPDAVNLAKIVKRHLGEWPF